MYSSCFHRDANEYFRMDASDGFSLRFRSLSNSFHKTRVLIFTLAE